MERRTETHIFPSCICLDGKTRIETVVVTNKTGNTYEFHEARAKVEGYTITPPKQ